MDLEALVAKYGEIHRALIVDALDWLERKEKQWNLHHPMSRDQFIDFLIVRKAEFGRYAEGPVLQIKTE